MAKEDFCFTYYDGDAARDMAHMNRLERGCYTDIIISQRKFGHMTLSQIKKVLSRDFDECWPAIELILKLDESGNYYIEWLSNSLEKMRKHSNRQKSNVQKRYQNATNELPKNDLVLPKNNLVMPLENEIENENISKEEGGMGEEGSGEAAILPKMLMVWKKENPGYRIVHDKDLSALRQIAVFITDKNGIEHLSQTQVGNLMQEWGKWCKHILTSPLKNKSLDTIAKFHLQEISNTLKNGAYKSNHQPRVNGKSSGAVELLNDLKTDLCIHTG